MTLGLARADKDGIHLAIDTSACFKGPPKIIRDARTVMGTETGKLIAFQGNPNIIVLGGGSIDHWIAFRHNWNENETALSPKCAADIVVGFLNDKATPEHQVFGRVCGYEGAEPVCYVVDRPLGANEASIRQRVLLNQETAVVGDYSTEALASANQKIKSGQKVADTIKSVIEELIKVDNAKSFKEQHLLGPVLTKTIPKPSG